MKMMIGENIKRLRKDKNITQEQLAEVLSLSCTAVSKWERGETYPDITLLQPLAYFFGVSVDDLLGYDEEKISKRISEQLDEYRRLERSCDPNTLSFITQLYHEYPNDYRVMNAYMWYITGDMADNDTAAILENENLLSSICERLLSGCTDENLRHQAWNMRGKILHAKGQTKEALTVYREHMSNWCQTAQQKSEQLFAKDTPEFLHWVKLNAYELASFCADKYHKSIFFDQSIPYKTRVARIEAFGDEVSELRKKTGEFFWAVMERQVMVRLYNDLIHRGGELEDIIRIGEKWLSSSNDIKALAEKEMLYSKENISKCYSNKQYISSILQSKHSRYIELLKNPRFAEMLQKYK